MIQSVLYSQDEKQTIYKIYSDAGYLIEKNGIYYETTYITKEDDIASFSETHLPIPARVASPNDVYSIFVQHNRVLLTDIERAHQYILQVARTIPENEAYKIWFLFPVWQGGESYIKNDIIFYNGTLFKVLNDLIAFDEPINGINYKQLYPPTDIVLEWGIDENKVYSVGERTKVGAHAYESLIDNNTWSPIDFPAAWKLIS